MHVPRRSLESSKIQPGKPPMSALFSKMTSRHAMFYSSPWRTSQKSTLPCHAYCAVSNGYKFNVQALLSPHLLQSWAMNNNRFTKLYVLWTAVLVLKCSLKNDMFRCAVAVLWQFSLEASLFLCSIHSLPAVIQYKATASVMWDLPSGRTPREAAEIEILRLDSGVRYFEIPLKSCDAWTRSKKPPTVACEFRSTDV